MKVIGIETSCDETAVAVIEIKNDQIVVLSNIISSQIEIHAEYGGVVPNLAAREHVKNIEHVFKTALKESRLIHDTRSTIYDLPVDLIAVTRGPGLGPALLVGLSFARTIAWKYKKPLVGVNHLEGHIYSNWLSPVVKNSKSQISNPKQISNSKIQKPEKNIFPILNLIISGGHTELVLMKDYGKYRLVGETLDDAVGEAFDKVARLLNLGYPGGPAISKQAEKYRLQIINPKYRKKSKIKNPEPDIQFPKPMEKSGDYNFSYSGLKTSVLYKLRDLKNAGIKISERIRNQIAYEFQKSAIDILIKKAVKAAEEYRVKSVFVSGGVSANKYLRENLQKEVLNISLNYNQPELEYTGDNAAMIALAGYLNYIKKYSSHKLSKNTADNSWNSVDVDPNLGF